MARQRDEHVRADFRRCTLVLSRQLPQHLQERLQRLGAQIVLAIPATHAHRSLGRSKEKALGKSCLAHAGRSDDRHFGSPARDHSCQRRVDAIELLRSPDERRESVLGARLEARARHRAAEDLEDGDRLFLASQPQHAAVLDVEKVAFAAERRRTDEDLVVDGEIGQPRGDVRRLATDHRQVIGLESDQPGVHACMQPRRCSAERRAGNLHFTDGVA